MGKTICTTVALGGLLVGAVGAAQGSPPGQGHGFHVPMPNQELYVEARAGRGGAAQSAECVLKLPTTMAPADLDERIVLAEPFPPVRVRQYLPQAVRRQEVVAEETGVPAISLAIVGRSQQTERWLVSGDAERGSLISLVGTWRYQAVADAAERDTLYRQFEAEHSRPAKLFVAREGIDAIEAMPAAEGTSQTFEKLGCKVSVLRFYPHFGMDAQTNEPVNQSDQKLNPAALVKLEHDGRVEQQWIFGKFPDFAAHGDAGAALRVRLDCPIETKNPAPDFVIVTVGKKGHEVWTRHEQQISAAELTLSEPVSIPGANYTFTVKQFVPAGRLVETYEPTTAKPGATTVVRVEVTVANGKDTPVWVELGKARVVPTDKGPVTVIFAARTPNPQGDQ